MIYILSPLVGSPSETDIPNDAAAYSWFNIHSKDFKLICEHAGTEPEYIIRLYDNLTYNYNSGKITKEQLKFEFEADPQMDMGMDVSFEPEFEDDLDKD